jgi:crossover junction endodeoxyribonuclease RuvC
MKILGIDPGSRVTGFGLIQIDKREAFYLASGCIRVKAETVDLRLKEIFEGLHEVIDTFAPDEAAIEQIFMHKSPDSALKLGQARGVAIVGLATRGLSVAEYSARQIKQAVVGYGAADKAQVMHMVQTLLKINRPLKSDAADALAVALCHFHTRQSLLHLEGATKTVRGRLR